MKAWITKYALTQGILGIDAKECGSNGMIEDTDRSHGPFNYYHGEGRDWHRTEEAALARAEQMRQDKLVSLRKQITKLERMTITFKDTTKP